MSAMQTIWAEQALTIDGWQSDVSIDIADDGTIASIAANTKPTGDKVGIIIPAPANVHSHSFQRALAGMTEQRGDDPNDNFWSWRKLMYKFLDHLTPEDIQAIAAFTQMEMLEAGFSCNTEFHYLHHQADGTPYETLAELSDRIIAASQESGIGLTLLPVLYQYGGCDKRPLGKGQIRFGNDQGRYAEIFETASKSITSLENDSRIGVAPHSLRAVDQNGLSSCVNLCPDGPIHIHIAEQEAEVTEVKEAWGQLPVQWLFDHYEVDRHWCLIHATQMQPYETVMFAKSGAIAGLCPITESNLGDGIFDGIRYAKNGGVFGIGSDSNIKISVAEELRTLEYSQRLRSKNRAVLATEKKSTGAHLLEGAAVGGGRAAGRKAGRIKVGRLADMMALDSDHVDLIGKQGDMTIDTFVFAGNKSMISDVWSAGRHMVKDGQHIKREKISNAYRSAIKAIQSKL